MKARRAADAPPQTELVFERAADRADAAARRLFRALGDAVDAVGLVVAAGACDCSKSELLDVLERRPSRYLRVEWMLAISAVAPPDYRRKILEALAGWLGYKVEQARPLTLAEKHERLTNRLLARFGAAGEELLEEIEDAT